MIAKLDMQVEKLLRHFAVFERVVEEHPIGIVKLSQITEYSHTQVRYSLKLLEEQELIEPTLEGAVPTGKAKQFIEDHDEQVDDVIAKLESFKGLEGRSIPT